MEEEAIYLFVYQSNWLTFEKWTLKTNFKTLSNYERGEKEDPET